MVSVHDLHLGATVAPSLLVTQCLQQDFVSPIGRFDPIPNTLHVGFSEARRLMGEDPRTGPVARMLDWAYDLPDDVLRLLHLRDWHDPEDPIVRAHLDQFGDHCLQGTPGARFAFPVPESSAKVVEVVDALSLNDFVGTRLEQVLEPYRGAPCKVGLVGVWTEAKVSFLAYELRTRYPEFEVAVCSALCASSTRHHHFAALDHMKRLLGVRVLDSLTEFQAFLTGEVAEDLPSYAHAGLDITVEGTLDASDIDQELMRYLFRDCQSVTFKVLVGGFSGNIVLGTTSIDREGHQQVPHVLKIGPASAMGQERARFERVQSVLGNNAPHIADFADLGGRGAVKYRYASMGGGFSSTFKSRVMSGDALETLDRILHTVFADQLGRLYQAATLEEGDLLEHYGFAARWAPGVQQRIEAVLDSPATGDDLTLLEGVQVPNLVKFYASLDRLPRRPGQAFHQAVVHGDLNGANIIIDGHDNVWLIDFFHTRRAHVLMDLVKVENDLLYIWTPLSSEHDLREAFKLTDALMAVHDLAAPLPEQCPSDHPVLQRTWHLIRTLRSFYAGLVASNRDPHQLHVAQLRYAAHTLGFDESSALQRRWALYTASLCAAAIQRTLTASTRLRVDWVESPRITRGRLGMTLLPGRQDYGRDLEADLATLQEDGVTHILTLVPEPEMATYGVGDLLPRLRAAGVQHRHLPIKDQHATSMEAVTETVAWMHRNLEAGAQMMVHCVGGLGRSGLLSASLLISRGADVDEALQTVRQARGPRCVETQVQEAFLHAFYARSAPH